MAKSWWKCTENAKSSGKVMAIVFWEVHGFVYINHLEKVKTVTAQYYSELLDRFDARKKSSFITTMHRHTKQLKR